MRWSPITSLVGRHTKNVLVIGIGDGRMVPAFDPLWSITGVDLGTVLAKQGQGMVDYRPPYCHGEFTLHPVSWTHGGDMVNSSVVEVLEKECVLGAYDLVIIDVDSVPTVARLSCRQRLASTGVPTFCKVLINKEDQSTLLGSFYSYRETGDHIWETPTYDGLEFILGGSAAPLGLYGAVGKDHNLDCAKVKRDLVNVSRTESLSLQEYFLTLTGDFHDTDVPLELSKCRSLWSFMPSEWENAADLIEELLLNHAPRKRIRALISLIQEGLIVGLGVSQ